MPVFSEFPVHSGQGVFGQILLNIASRVTSIANAAKKVALISLHLRLITEKNSEKPALQQNESELSSA
jgi:hypothetical protein